MEQKRGKRAQGSIFGMSFTTIFSIILIVFFIVIAFIVINKVLEISKCGKIGIFKDDLQDNIDSAWNSQEKSAPITNKNLPSEIKYVCFANLSKDASGGDLEKEIYNEISIWEYTGDNMFFYPRDKACKMPNHEIKHIDLEYLTKTRNPKCFPVEKGKIDLRVEFGPGMRLVKIN